MMGLREELVREKVKAAEAGDRSKLLEAIRLLPPERREEVEKWWAERTRKGEKRVKELGREAAERVKKAAENANGEELLGLVDRILAEHRRSVEVEWWKAWEELEERILELVE